MIKFLLDSDVFIAAEKKEKSAAARLISECRDNDDLQAWTLATTPGKLASEGLSPERIVFLLKRISQIPVNAFLNDKAIGFEAGIEAGLLKAAAETFKIPILVSSQYSDAGLGGFISCEEALKPRENESQDKVDFLNLNFPLHSIFEKVDGWFMDIIQKSAFAGGNHVDQFEKEFSAFCGSKYTVGVNSGTDALRFALIAMGIGKGDEVITVPNTFIATSEVVSQVGALPVFVDVLEDTYTIDPDLIESSITDKTKAIIPVHLYGQVANMNRIMEIAEKYRLLVLEDACQAHGAKYEGRRAGVIGHAAAFSMYPGKNLGAFGEAGCLVTNDDEINAMVRCLRDHGQSRKYYHKMEGYNGRMDNLQAAALRSKLVYLDEWNEKRREIAKWYAEYLKDADSVILPEVPDYSAHVFHLFVVLVPDPNALSDHLKKQEIHTGFHYPVPLHLQEAYQDHFQSSSSFPVAEACAKKLLSLPMFPELTRGQVKKVCDMILQFFS
jgi:dTDP-4-amino-4,6-dideoxygalactose transaminase